MPESETQPDASERERKPALPPFGGAAAPAGLVLRPGTDLRGRKTLPPFFGPPIRPGGPLPGAAARPQAPVVTRPRPSVHPRPGPRPVSVAEPTPSHPTPQTPPAPSWDTPPMASAIALDVWRTKRPDPATSTGEAEWAAPLPDNERTAGADSAGEPFASDPVETAAGEEVPAQPELEYPGAPDLQADPEYATRTHENLPMATDQTSRGDDAFDATATTRRRTPVLG